MSYPMYNMNVEEGKGTEKGTNGHELRHTPDSDAGKR